MLWLNLQFTRFFQMWFQKTNCRHFSLICLDGRNVYYTYISYTSYLGYEATYRLSKLHGVLQDPPQVGLTHAANAEVVRLLHVLDPAVGLALRVDHQRPTSGRTVEKNGTILRSIIIKIYYYKVRVFAGSLCDLSQLKAKYCMNFI